MHTPIRRLFGHPWGWASLAPLLCAVHCAVTPLLVLVAPAVAPGERVEWLLLVVSVGLAGGAFVGARRAHRELAPFLPVAVGLVAWTGSLLHLYQPLPETVTTVAASLMVATGLLWNSRVHCATRAVPCSACRVELEGAAAAVAPVTARPPEGEGEATAGVR